MYGQLRLHDSTGTDLYLHTISAPIIERCEGLRYADYPPSLGAVDNVRR